MTDTTQERRTGAGIHYGAAPEVKQKHRAMWALGDYPAVAHDIVAPLGALLVDACLVTAGDRVLDVAAGTGTVAIPAAEAGASVTASDLTPSCSPSVSARPGPRASTSRGRRGTPRRCPTPTARST